MRHQTSCEFNPKNHFTFPESDIAFIPAEFSPPPSLPQTPAQQLNEFPLTPSQATPRQNIWITKGCSGIYLKKHPYLDGKLA